MGTQWGVASGLRGKTHHQKRHKHASKEKINLPSHRGRFFEENQNEWGPGEGCISKYNPFVATLPVADPTAVFARVEGGVAYSATVNPPPLGGFSATSSLASWMNNQCNVPVLGQVLSSGLASVQAGMDGTNVVPSGTYCVVNLTLDLA